MKTICIQLPFKVLTLTLGFLLLFVGIIEISLRNESISYRLAAPSFGSEHHQFEVQLARLKTAYQKQGSIDCIFVGDSLVWLDLDPLKFGEGYRDKTGKEIMCFNFGITALPASGVSEITSILVSEYNPQLIIYGLHANSVVVARDNEDTKIVLDTPWVRHKSGTFDARGWLYEISYFVRYRQVLNRLMRFDREALQNETGTEPHQMLGFDPKNGQRLDLSIPPSRSNAADIKGFEKYYQYHIFPENLTGIRTIASMSDDDTRVVMLMMPVNKSFYAFFENGEQDYMQIANDIQQELDGTDTIFLKTDDTLLSFDDLWWDYSHLNHEGASKFSYWLGEQVAALDGQENVGVIQP